MNKIVLIILFLSLFLYCGPKQQQVERYMEDGVEVVVNYQAPYKIKGEKTRLILEEEFTIDTAGHKLSIFDTDGNLIKEFPMDMNIARPGTAIIPLENGNYLVRRVVFASRRYSDIIVSLFDPEFGELKELHRIQGVGGLSDKLGIEAYLYSPNVL